VDRVEDRTVGRLGFLGLQPTQEGHHGEASGQEQCASDDLKSEHFSFLPTAA
jgi:hypothetical protein